MRSVMRYPLTTLSTARNTAEKPRMRESVLASFSPVSRMAPTTVMAEMALVSDISGVCSKRRNAANELEAQERRQHKNPQIKFVAAHLYLLSPAGAALAMPNSSLTRGFTTSRPCVTNVSRMISSSRLMVSSPFLTISFRKAAMFDRIHLAGVIGRRGRQIERAQNRDALMHHRLARPRQLAIAAALGRDIHDHRTRRHGARHLRGHQNRSFLARNRRGGDHHVLLADHFLERRALAAVELFVHRLGVSALPFRRAASRSSTTNFAPRLSICSFTALRTS